MTVCTTATHEPTIGVPTSTFSRSGVSTERWPVANAVNTKIAPSTPSSRTIGAMRTNVGRPRPCAPSKSGSTTGAGPDGRVVPVRAGAGRADSGSSYRRSDTS